MFKLVKQAQAWWPVKFDGVADDGAIVPQEFEMRFRLLKVDAAAAFFGEVADAQRVEESGAVDLAGLYAGLVARVAADWRGILAENDDPLPFNDANLSALMNEPGMFTHVFTAFRRCQAAAPEIRAGKLKAVARRWASGRGGGAPASDPATDAAAAEIAAIAARRATGRSESEPEISPEEADVVTLFFALSSQWRFHAMGSRLGLDYAVMPATAGMLGIAMTPALFADLQVMEGAALIAFAG